jgi:hypothetical protein
MTYTATCDHCGERFEAATLEELAEPRAAHASSHPWPSFTLGFDDATQVARELEEARANRVREVDEALAKSDVRMVRAFEDDADVAPLKAYRVELRVARAAILGSDAPAAVEIPPAPAP